MNYIEKLEEMPIIKRELEDPGGEYSVLVNEVKQMRIDGQYLSGDIIVMGQDDALPERCLLCTPETRFRILNGDISKLIYVSPKSSNYSPGAVLHPTTHIENFPWPEELKALPHGGVANYSLDTIEHVFRNHLPSSSFNAIFEFQSEELGEQLKTGVLEFLLCSKLMPGGVFIGSGHIDEHLYQDLQQNGIQGMDVIQATHVTPLFGRPFPNYVGIILQKPLQ